MGKTKKLVKPMEEKNKGGFFVFPSVKHFELDHWIALHFAVKQLLMIDLDSALGK